MGFVRVCVAAALAAAPVFAKEYAVKCDQTNDEGKKFLSEKANDPNVKVLESGLMYEVLKKGDGTKHPLPNQACDCHYAGTLIDGTEFDSSIKRGQPTTFAPNQVIKGWTEAMQHMVEGDKWRMYIPAGLAYGSKGAGGKIPGGAALVFEMELIKIKGDKTKDAPNPAKFDTEWHGDKAEL